MFYTSKIDFEGILGKMPFLTITDGECAEEEKVCPNSCHSIETNEAVPVCGKDYINYPTRFVYEEGDRRIMEDYYLKIQCMHNCM